MVASRLAVAQPLPLLRPPHRRLRYVDGRPHAGPAQGGSSVHGGHLVLGVDAAEKLHELAHALVGLVLLHPRHLDVVRQLADPVVHPPHRREDRLQLAHAVGVGRLDRWLLRSAGDDWVEDDRDVVPGIDPVAARPRGVAPGAARPGHACYAAVRRLALDESKPLGKVAVEVGVRVDVGAVAVVDFGEAVRVELPHERREVAVLEVQRQELRDEALDVQDGEAGAVARPGKVVVSVGVGDH